MPQISQIGFSNFRIFNQTTKFDLTNINIMTGTNGSGKSSVIKGLLLFFQSLEENKKIENLNFNSGDHKLGGFQSTLCNYSEADNIMEFSLQLDFSKPWVNGIEGDETKIIFKPIITVDFSFKFIKNAVILIWLDIRDDAEVDKPFFKYFYDFQESEPKNKEFTFLKLDLNRVFDRVLELAPKNSESINKSNLYSEFENYRYGSKGVDFQRLNDLKDGILKKNMLRNIVGKGNEFKTQALTNAIIDIDILNADEIVPSGKTKPENKLDQETFLKNVAQLYIDDRFMTASDALHNYYPFSNFEQAVDEFFDFLTNKEREPDGGISGSHHLFFQKASVVSPELPGKLMDYLKPELLEVFKLVKGSIDTIISSLKSFKFNYIPAFRGIPQRIYLFQDNDSIINKFINEVNLSNLKTFEKDFLNFWLNEFEIAENVEFETIENVGVVIHFLKDNQKINIVDMGFGVTQIFPLLLGVIINCEKKKDYLDNPPLNILLLEEPETNLHPALQSKLGDFFIDAIKKFNVKLIIETHSEYIIRKLQYQVAKKNILPTDVNIYYFNKQEFDTEPKNFELIKQIRIQENGFLDGEFGSGFFDVADDLYLELLNNNNNE